MFQSFIQTLNVEKNGLLIYGHIYSFTIIFLDLINGFSNTTVHDFAFWRMWGDNSFAIGEIWGLLQPKISAAMFFCAIDLSC